MTQYICENCGTLVLCPDGEQLLFHCGDHMAETDVPEAIRRQYSRTHQLVYHSIREHGPITGKEIATTHDVSDGSVYPALKDLDREQHISHRMQLEGRKIKEYVTGPDAGYEAEALADD